MSVSREQLEEELRPWLLKHPELEVEYATPAGHPADELLRLAETARLLVVGSHGHNALARFMLGSVAAVTGATCPVAVVRPGAW